MKKQLLSTSAIALGVAMAAPAAAQDWNLDWGGFVSTHVAFADVSGTALAAGSDFDGLDVFSTGEIQFTPSVTLDNGLTFGVNIQYETMNNIGAIVDESFISISGNFGQIDLGSENSAGYKSMTAAPGVTSMWINSPSISAFIPRTGSGGFLQAGLSAYTEVAGNNDAQRITYYTPSFNGLTVGVSYAATAGGGGSVNNYAPNRNAVLSDIFDIGVSYSGSFGNGSVSLGARWGTADSPVAGVSDPETWGLGASVSFGGITIGGHYAENDNGAPGGAGDQEGWSFGITYDAPGPWSFEALTLQGSVDNGIGFVDSDHEHYRIGASRDVGPGVDWDIYAVMAESNNAAGANIEGTVIGTAINLSF